MPPEIASSTELAPPELPPDNAFLTWPSQPFAPNHRYQPGHLPPESSRPATRQFVLLGEPEAWSPFDDDAPVDGAGLTTIAASMSDPVVGAGWSEPSLLPEWDQQVFAEEDDSFPSAEDLRLSFKTDLRELCPMLWEDTCSVITWRNTFILGAATGIALWMRDDLDGDVRQYTAEYPLRWGSGSKTLNHFGHPKVQVPAIAAVYAVSLWEQDGELHEFSQALISGYTITSLTTLAIKGMADTQRPDPQKYGGHWGFPSYHTSSSFAIAATIDEYYGWKAGLPAYMFAGLIGWSRIDQREHDLSDVFFGATLGYVIGKSVSQFHRTKSSSLYIVPYIDVANRNTGLVLDWAY